MSFGAIIENLLIGPLKLLFEIIFQLANRFVHHPGISIIFLSLIMNILVLPLYRQADAKQEEARDIDAKLHHGVSHIKKVFSGDERMMILQAYYRQNNYKPTDALHGSISLLLEIPFFMAAYQFLSHLDILKGVSLGPIADLSVPDGIITIGALSVNLLPILMTLVNVISSAIYLKGFPLKTKIQLYGMALFFLVFLYESPAGLVFYWTLNNVFSLVKTIFYKIPNPQKVLRILTSLTGIVLIAFGGFIYDTDSVKRKLFLVLVGLALEVPLVSNLLKGKVHLSPASDAEPNKKLFLLGAAFLTFFTGLFIPSNFIADSPQEYVDVTYFHNPLWYIVSSLAFAAGTFLIWMSVFYWLSGKKGKVLFGKIVWIMCGIFLINYMFFGTDLGVISPTLRYEDGMTFTLMQQLINLLVLIAAAALLYLIVSKAPKAVTSVLLVCVIAIGAMSGLNLITTKSSVDEISVEQYSETPHFQLSKKGKNVVVIMLDRAFGIYVPYIFDQNPELKEKFDGFTYYSNTISYSGVTNHAAPALFGGYEYTPVEINKRDKELLVDKHNEALQIMPALFHKNGFDVTVCDPVYANYGYVPDLSLFDKYEGMNKYITGGRFSDNTDKETTIQKNNRNFFCFSIMKSMPLCIQTTIYNNGLYNQAPSDTEAVTYGTQTMSGTKAKGIDKKFMDSYNVLSNLLTMTNILDEEKDTFMYMVNETTHNPTLLQLPDYTPSLTVDNSAFETADAFTLDGKTIDMSTEKQITHYHCNVASFIQLGNWLDYLKENDIYDNTKIILVSDHSTGAYHSRQFDFNAEGNYLKDLEFFFPLLMVKEFDSEGFNISDEFMTNADVPTIAFDGLIKNPVNPFTGKEINNDEKYAHDHFIAITDNWNTAYNNGYTFLPTEWVSLKNNNIWDKNNWTFNNKEVVLSEHSFE